MLEGKATHPRTHGVRACAPIEAEAALERNEESAPARAIRAALVPAPLSVWLEVRRKLSADSPEGVVVKAFLVRHTPIISTPVASECSGPRWGVADTAHHHDGGKIGS